MASFDPFRSGQARRHGLIHFLLGSLVFGVGAAFAFSVSHFFKYELSLHDLLALALPGAYALAGLIEFITEVPFVELAQRWDSLRGWQRGVLGTFVVAVATCVIFAVICLVAI